MATTQAVYKLGGKGIDIVGNVTERVLDLLGISECPADRKIYFGETNLEHMQNSHPSDFAKYGRELKNILAHPNYVGQNPSDGSIEYVKEYLVDGEYVKVAVRLSNTQRFYARSLYVLNPERVERFIKKGTLLKI